MNENEIKKETLIADELPDEKEVAADTDEATEAIGNFDESAAAPAAEAAGGAPAGERAGEEQTEETSTEISEGQENEAAPAGEDAATESPRGGALPEISNSDMRKIMADPMFVCFAKGKTADIETLCREFCEMLECGSDARTKTNLDRSVLVRVTPYADGTIRSDVILTERQRTLAREAGMTYREYYDLINDIPERKSK